MTNNMIAQVESLPALIRTEIKNLDRKIRLTFNHNEILSTKKIFITGCGDSYFAGLAAKLAFRTWCALPVEVKSSLPAGRYELPFESQAFPNNPMVIGISVSGGVTRTIEAINIANEMGASTVAITGNPDSQLGQSANKLIDCSIPDFVDAPGVRSYQISLLALKLIALHFAEVREKMSMSEADRLRSELLGMADVIEATIEKNKAAIKDLAVVLAPETTFHFVSHGPNLATARFCAAKIVESTGRYAVGQDTEEWAHLEYFNDVKSDVPTFVISPGYRSHALLAEFCQQMKRVERNVIAITPENDSVVAPHANYHLPVIGAVREEISPFVYKTSGEIFAAYFADSTGEKFFRHGNRRYQVSGDHRKTSQVRLRDLK